MNLNAKYYLYILISLLYVPIAFVVANYSVFLSVTILNQLNGTNFRFISTNYSFHILFIFCVLILIFINWISKIIINISNDILVIADEIQQINSQNTLPHILNSSTKKSEINVLYNSVNNLIVRLKKNQIERMNLEEIHSKYLAQISHDIKTPLSLIRISLYYLENNMNYEESISDIKHNIKVIEKLSDQIKVENDFGKDSNLDLIINEIYLKDFFETALLKWNSVLKKQFKIYLDIDKTIILPLNTIWFERLIDNIIQNIVFHSKAKNVNIQVFIVNDATKIVITDDGKGFDYNQVIESQVNTKGKGLNIINDISHILNLELEYITSPNKGTKIVLTHYTFN